MTLFSREDLKKMDLELEGALESKSLKVIIKNAKVMVRGPEANCSKA